MFDEWWIGRNLEDTVPYVITIRGMAHAVGYSSLTAEVWVNPTLLCGICGGLSDTQFSSPNSAGFISQTIHTHLSFIFHRRCMKLPIDVVVKQQTKESDAMKWGEVGYGEVPVDKGAMYIRVTLYWGYLIVLWLFHLGISCIWVCFNLYCGGVILFCDVWVFCSVWVCVCVGFVMCGCVYVWVL